MALREPKSGDQALRIADALRDDIVAGHLAAGLPLRQETLAARFGTSRMPVREALRLLEQQGLVLQKPHYGAVVAPLDALELRELVDMRASAETLALRLAIPNLTNRQIDRAEALQDEAEAGPIETFGRLNAAFHATLYKPSGRPRLLAHIAELGDSVDRYLRVAAVHLDYADRSHREHRALLAACGARNADQASEILRAHIENAGHALLDHLFPKGQN
ncbi:MAG: GntR family transcriptional regulator [Pseudomonadota bacterium]